MLIVLNVKNLQRKEMAEIIGKNIIGKKICFLGVTFKPNTDDMREASSLFMIPNLVKKGALIRYYDPTGKKEEFNNLKNVRSCKNISDACYKSDMIIIHTEWNEFKLLNFKKIVKKNKFIVYDLRNLYSPFKMKKNGVKYFGIGR